MKKIFNLIAVVFIASAIFVSCKKDDSVIDDTTGATIDADEDWEDATVSKNTVKVTFGEEIWYAEYYIPALQMIEGDSVAQILAQRDEVGDLEATQSVRIGMRPRIGKEKASAAYETNEIQHPIFDNPNLWACDYFENGYLVNQAGERYGNWWGKKISWKISAFDATSLNMQISLKATMFDANAVLVDKVPFKEAETEKMRIVANVMLENR